MCRGGSISVLLIAAAMGLAGCVDADNAMPGMLQSPVMSGGSTAPRAGTGGGGVATTPPVGGPAGMMAPKPPTAGMTAPVTAGTTAPTTAGSGGMAGGMATAGKAGGAAGGAGGASGGAGGGGAAAGPKFSEVFPILMSKCAGCHGAAGGVMFGTKDAAYMSLMSMGSGMCSSMKKVTPNMPDMSVLILALKGMGCRMGRPMPPAGGMLPADDIKKISDWIAAGAKND